MFASKQPVQAGAYDGLMMGLGFTFVLVVLGAMREVLGAGTLFAGAALLLGDTFKAIEINLPNFDGMLLFALPPGGFVVLGFLLAGKKVIDAKMAQRREALAQPAAAE